MVIYEHRNCISLLPNDQQQDFPPNSKQTFICSVTEAVSHLQIRVSHLHTCTHYIMIYNSSSQEGKHQFSLFWFQRVALSGVFGLVASSFQSSLLTSVSSKTYLWGESWQLACYTDMFGRKMLTKYFTRATGHAGTFQPQCICKLKPTRELFHL